MAQSNRRVVLTVGIIALVGLAIGVGLALTFGAASGKHTITGVISVHDPKANTANGNCVLSADAPDVNVGTTVKITNEHKELLGSATLGAAKRMPGSKTTGCEFTFFVRNVPDASTYNVQVGNTGSVAYTQDQLSEAGWAVSLNINP